MPAMFLVKVKRTIPAAPKQEEIVNERLIDVPNNIRGLVCCVLPSSDVVLVEIPPRSPQKLFIFVMKKTCFLGQRIQKLIN